MVQHVNGNYELRVAVLHAVGNEVDNNTSDEEFYIKAEEQGTVYSVGFFQEQVNNQELDDLTGSYIRFVLVNTDNPESEVIGADGDFYVNKGEIVY